LVSDCGAVGHRSFAGRGRVDYAIGRFALHARWWIAAIVLIVWLIGFVFRAGEGRRWYRW
jgi:hypothetical protein